MAATTPTDNTVLQLSPPNISGKTEPVEGARVGLAKVFYELIPDGKGAHVVVDPPLKGTMDTNDVMTLLLKGESAVLDSFIIVDPDERTYLRIPNGRLHPDRVNELYYTVTRGSDNVGTFDPPLTVLYNLIRPGLKDRYDAPGGHSELKLLLPNEIKNGVGQDFVSAEVCVAYPYCRAYDVITLKCNGEFLEPKPRVNPNQAPPPPNPGDENPITICFTITRAFLDTAKRLDKKLHFSYTVTDQLGNGPDTDAPWSPVQIVDEDLDGTRLPMPILLEREEDFPGDDASIIDLEKLAGNPLLLVVLTTDNRFVVGYDVIATYTAKNTGQPGDVVETVSGKVEADRFGAKQTLFLEVPNAKVFAGSSVTVTYDLLNGGDLVGSSSTATATVTGAEPAVLPPPRIKEAPNNTSLDPLAAKDALTAVISAYANMVGTQITVSFSGTPGSGSQTVGPINVTTQGEQSIPLSNAVLAFNLGKTVTVTYIVTRGGVPSNPSDPLVLTVLRIADANPAMGMPLITQAANNGAGPEFNVSALTTNATMRVNSWPLIALKQFVWLFLIGTKADGSAYTRTFWQPPSSQTNSSWISNGFYTHSLPMADAKALKDDSLLRLVFKVGLGGSHLEIDAVTFAERVYIVKSALDLKAPRIKEAPNNVLQPIAAKDRLTAVVPAFESMIGTNVVVEWEGTAGGGSATVGPIDITAQADKEIPLPNTVVAFNLGKTVKLTYTVARNGTSLGFKESSLAVQQIADGDNNLPTPNIGGVEDATLDVTKLTDDAQLRIATWLLQASNQCVWLRYDGTDKNGNAVEKVFWTGSANQETDGLVTPAQVAWLRELKEGSTLRITFKVNFDKVPNADTAVGFPVRTYAIKAKREPVRIFTSGPATELSNNQQIDIGTATITRKVISGAPRADAGGIGAVMYDGRFSPPVSYGEQLLNFNLKGDNARSFIFDLYAESGYTNSAPAGTALGRIDFFDDSTKLIHTYVIREVLPRARQIISISLPDNQLCCSFEIRAYRSPTNFTTKNQIGQITYGDELQ